MGYSGTEVTLFIIGQLLVAAAIWGGIRADLRAIHAKVADAKATADKAHERLDEFLLNGGGKGPHYRRSTR